MAAVLASNTGYAPSTAERLITLVSIAALVSVLPSISRRLHDRFGVGRLTLMVLIAWPIGTVWYALTLDSWDIHYFERWSWGAQNGALIVTAIWVALVLAARFRLPQVNDWDSKRALAADRKSVTYIVLRLASTLFVAIAAFTLLGALVSACAER